MSVHRYRAESVEVMFNGVALPDGDPLDYAGPVESETGLWPLTAEVLLTNIDGLAELDEFIAQLHPWIPIRLIVAADVARALPPANRIASEGCPSGLPLVVMPWLEDGTVLVEERHRTETKPGLLGPEPFTRIRHLGVVKIGAPET